MKALVPVLLILALSGCIEVRDKNQNNEPEQKITALAKKVSKHGDLFIDETLYLHDGQFLNQSAYFEAIKNSPTTQVQEYNFSYERLTITSRGRLYTMGHTLRMSVEDFQSKGGFIATFPEGKKALPGQNGKSGGDLLLEFKKAEGLLDFTLRGEHGGAGINGAEPDQNINGKNGRDGYFSTWGGGDAQRGEDGKPGYNGGNGGRGGNSGKLLLKLGNSQTLQYSINRFYGKGGELGRGGAGGHPGLGGMPYGSSIRLGGALQGPPGADGQTGLNGMNEEFCVEIFGHLECKTGN